MCVSQVGLQRAKTDDGTHKTPKEAREQYKSAPDSTPNLGRLPTDGKKREKIRTIQYTGEVVSRTRTDGAACVLKRCRPAGSRMSSSEKTTALNKHSPLSPTALCESHARPSGSGLAAAGIAVGIANFGGKLSSV